MPVDDRALDDVVFAIVPVDDTSKSHCNGIRNRQYHRVELLANTILQLAEDGSRMRSIDSGGMCRLGGSRYDS